MDSAAPVDSEEADKVRQQGFLQALLLLSKVSASLQENHLFGAL